MGENELLILRAGSLELRLNPSIGGSIEAFEWFEEDRSIPLLRKCNSREPSVLDMACFPLVPFVNRIRRGQFTFRGHSVALQPNMAADISPLHGQGWLNPWSVVSHGNQDAELRFVHEAGEWPWRYEALQVLALDELGLSARLMCRNLSDEPMPCGLGFHPYFPCGPETVLDTEVEVAWEIDEHVLPTRKVPASGRYDLRHRAVCGQNLDNGFGKWGGLARITDPGWPVRIALSSPTARFFQLYSPESGGIFVAEPVTHANAALNAPQNDWPELGMEVLEPGDEMALEMRLEITPA